ncbi:MAG: NAD-dependent epimerase/dehydratase family protein [Gemmatimonadaceae bacterium]|nr:NAD-dependent epimerase/dehydratase family protein [Gemmatimonadaceae bacterium]
MSPTLRTVLVTGASGFLGSHTCRTLAAQGIAVRAHGRQRSRMPSAPGITPCLGDLRDLPTLTAAAAGCDAIVHAAALSAPWGPRAEFHATNVIGTEHVIAAARAAGVRRLVHISSPAVLFDGRDQHDLSDSAPYPRHFSSRYAETKQQAELRVRATPGDLECIILRPKAIYGEGDRSLVPRLLRAASAGRLPQVGDGRNRVDVTHVDDVVQAVECALHTRQGIGETFLITGGEHVLLWSLIRELLTGAGLPYPSRILSVRTALAAAAAMEVVAAVTRREPLLTRYSALILARTQTCDIGRARALLGYMPRVSSTDGVARTIDALRTRWLAI